MNDIMNDITTHKVSTIKEEGYGIKKYSDSEIKKIIDTSEAESTSEKVQNVANKKVEEMAMGLSHKKYKKLVKILPKNQADRLKCARQEGSTPILETNTPPLGKKLISRVYE